MIDSNKIVDQLVIYLAETILKNEQLQNENEKQKKILKFMKKKYRYTLVVKDDIRFDNNKYYAIKDDSTDIHMVIKKEQYDLLNEWLETAKEDFIGYLDINGNQIRIGDRLKTNEAGWIGNVVLDEEGKPYITDNCGGYSYDFSGAEIIK